MKISVVIPVFRETGIALLLDDLLARPDLGDTEILVVDGAPEADTLARIHDPRVVRLSSLPGRGVQQNAGARKADGDILVFLHADTVLPQGAFDLVRQTLADPSLAGGAFRLSYAGAGPGLNVLAAAANLRTRLTRAPYGDQAIFLRGTIFENMHGFATIPIMEDLDLMTRLRRSGQRIRILDEPVRTSGRRQLREGLVQCTLRNLCLRLLHHCGVPPAYLARLYRRHGD
jgi:rSAM/selenodomain-associated transferase 2